MPLANQVAVNSRSVRYDARYSTLIILEDRNRTCCEIHEDLTKCDSQVSNKSQCQIENSFINMQK